MALSALGLQACANLGGSHSSYLIRIAKKTILIDPVFENAGPVFFMANRFQPAILTRADLPPVDYVLISHDHYDHLEDATIKHIDGLSALVQTTLRQQPTCGSAFVFRGHRGDRIKLLMWDGQGFYLYHKVLERGRFHWPSVADGTARLTSAHLAMPWEGIDCLVRPGHRRRADVLEQPSNIPGYAVDAFGFVGQIRYNRNMSQPSSSLPDDMESLHAIIEAQA